MRSITLGISVMVLSATLNLLAANPQEKQEQNKSAVNIEPLETGPEAQELNPSPNPTPDQSSEAFPGTLSIGESYSVGPYDREGAYIFKPSPEEREAQEAIEAQEEKQEEMERIHGEELLDFSTGPQREMNPPLAPENR